jgi:hypothetical protein
MAIDSRKEVETDKKARKKIRKKNPERERTQEAD